MISWVLAGGPPFLPISNTNFEGAALFRVLCERVGVDATPNSKTHGRGLVLAEGFLTSDLVMWTQASAEYYECAHSM
jgi:hypothetical protein